MNKNISKKNKIISNKYYILMNLEARYNIVKTIYVKLTNEVLPKLSSQFNNAPLLTSDQLDKINKYVLEHTKDNLKDEVKYHKCESKIVLLMKNILDHIIQKNNQHVNDINLCKLFNKVKLVKIDYDNNQYYIDQVQVQKLRDLLHSFYHNQQFNISYNDIDTIFNKLVSSLDEYKFKEKELKNKPVNDDHVASTVSAITIQEINNPSNEQKVSINKVEPPTNMSVSPTALNSITIENINNEKQPISPIKVEPVAVQKPVPLTETVSAISVVNNATGEKEKVPIVKPELSVSSEIKPEIVPIKPEIKQETPPIFNPQPLTETVSAISVVNNNTGEKEKIPINKVESPVKTNTEQSVNSPTLSSLTIETIKPENKQIGGKHNREHELEMKITQLENELAHLKSKMGGYRHLNRDDGSDLGRMDYDMPSELSPEMENDMNLFGGNYSPSTETAERNLKKALELIN